MKIVYIYPQVAERAGTERILTDKMNYLAEQFGHEIVLLTYEQCSRPLAFPLSPKVKHVDLEMRYYPYYRYNLFTRLYKWRQLDKVLQKRYNDFMAGFHPDIVITTTSYARPVEMVCRCPITSARVLESHIDRLHIMNNDPVNRRNPKEWLLGYFDMCILIRNARKFNVLVALNQPDADDWSRFLKTTVITNTVHLNPTGQQAHLEKKHVIFVGRYTLQKGIPDLFKIWEIVHARYPDWHLDLYGEGGMRDEIISMAQRLDANINVHNPSSSIFDCYLDSSIFVLTSLYEPFGLVLPEAMSCGLPVVAFDCPYGPANIITDGVDGYLIKERRRDLFAEKLCLLIESRDLRVKMGHAALQSSKRYSPSFIMPLWENLFRKLQRIKY